MWVPSVFCLWTAVFIHSCSCWDTLRGIPAEASEIYTQVEDGESRISQKELQPTRAHMNEAIRFTYNKCHFHGTYQKDARHCTKTTGPGTVLIQSRVHGHPWCVFFVILRLTLTLVVLPLSWDFCLGTVTAMLIFDCNNLYMLLVRLGGVFTIFCFEWTLSTWRWGIWGNHPWLVG